MHLIASIIPVILALTASTSGDESQFSINNNKVLQLLDEKFISITIDPAIFFSGLINKPIIYKLIEHLKPAYLRIAGPSTQFLEFNVDPTKATKLINDASTTLTFSPAMWWSLNDWIQKTNLTPIYALNDAQQIQHKWDVEKSLPLLDMTEKMNINCYWQLGFDCSSKGFERYKDDLSTLRHVLDAFPTKKNSWQIIGSDLSKCTPSDHPEILRMYLADLQDADVIMWEHDESSASSSFLGDDAMKKLLSLHQASVPLWLSTAKSGATPISFDDAVHWAVEVGEAAKNGFAVIFREPRVQEYYTPTPAYWVTVLHKKLMGRNVLDVKTTWLTKATTATTPTIYAHCAKDPNAFAIRGALTVMIVNNGSDAHKSAFRMPTPVKSIEVRAYILHAGNTSMDTYLNGEPLTMSGDVKLQPQFRRAKIRTHLMLEVPAKSIGFFVLPGAKIPACIDNEDDTDVILAEINHIQDVDFPDTEKSNGLFSRSQAERNSLTLADLHRKFEEELKMDTTGVIPKLRQSTTKDDLRQQLTLKLATPKGDAANEKKHLFVDTLKVTGVQKFMDKAKAKDVKHVDFKNLLMKKVETAEKKEESKPKMDLDLSSVEVLRILEDRARGKLEKKVGLADWDGILENALRVKFKRDINMALLKQKVHDQEEKGGLFKTKKLLKESTVDNDDDDNDGTPDMSKIIPGLDTRPKSLLKNIAVKPKLEIFNGDAMDISSLFSLLKVKTTTSTTPASPKFAADAFDVEDKSAFDKELEDLGHHGFFEHFGDSVSIVPQRQHEDFPELGAAAWDFDDDLFRNNEFIINNGDVPGTIKQLEDYFNNKPATRQNGGDHQEMHFEPVFDQFDAFGRFKRDKMPNGNDDDVYVPNVHVANKILKSYEPKLSFKERRPEDILSLPQLHGVYTLGARKERISFDAIPMRADGINSRSARHIAGDINSMENTIDDFLNGIEKDGALMKPFAGDEIAEYTIVFPAHDKPQQDNAGSANDATCPATDLYPSSSTTSTDNILEVTTSNRVDRSEFVQKIPMKPKQDDNNNKQPPLSDEPIATNFMTRMMGSVRNFFKRITKKVGAFFVTDID